MTLSDEQKKEYIKSHGVMCPYCGSLRLGGDIEHPEFEYKYIVQITCEQCKKRWKETYEITNIEEME